MRRSILVAGQCLDAQFEVGLSWDRAATTVWRLTCRDRRGAPRNAADEAALAAAATSCRQLRFLLLADPAAPLPLAVTQAAGRCVPPESLASWLEQVERTLNRLKDSPRSVTPSPAEPMLRAAEFLADSGQALMRDIARKGR